MEECRAKGAKINFHSQLVKEGDEPSKYYFDFFKLSLGDADPTGCSSYCLLEANKIHSVPIILDTMLTTWEYIEWANASLDNWFSCRQLILIKPTIE